MFGRLSIALVWMASIGFTSSCQKAPAGAPATAPADSDNVKIQFLVSVPSDTDPKATIYLAGNLAPIGAWKANGLALRKIDDAVYAATVELPRGKTLEYKITRGSWETVETGPDGEGLDNRIVNVDGEKVERATVTAWSAVPARPKVSTITGDVRAHEIHSNILNNDRKLWVYLPPGYATDKSLRYPVLYMHDGQNLFDDATSFAGEWQADETAQRLIEAGTIPPIIIVGIENNAQREDEYTPTQFENSGGRGDQYARFVIEEVKPFVDRAFRTRPEAAATGIAGSSLGALISIHMAMKHPETFGKCGAVSPSLWWDHEKLVHDIERDNAWAKRVRVWIDTGTAENSNQVRSATQVLDCRALANALKRAGLVADRDFAYREYAGAAHNESAWAQRFGEMLVFLYGR